MQQHRAASPPALLPFPGPASVLLVINGAIDLINNSVIPWNGRRRIANVYNFSTLVLSLVGAVVDTLNLTAVADADVVVVTAIAVIAVLLLSAF